MGDIDQALPFSMNFWNQFLTKTNKCHVSF